MASKGLLWVGTNVGIALSIPLPRLEGVPIISGRANVSHHAHSGPITFFLTLQMPSKAPSPPVPTTPLPPLPSSLPLHSGTIQEESENESTSPRSKAPASCAQSVGNFNTIPKTTRSPSFVESPLALRRKSKECSPLLSKRLSRTLPRGHVSSTTECDIFGLYGELMNIKDYEESDGSSLMGGGGGAGTVNGSMYETLRRSDPDLAAIPAKLSTLDRRLHMKAARPRSLDLSNWSVDSRSSLYTTSSGSEDSASHTLTPTALSSSAGQTSTLKRNHQRNNSDTLKSSSSSSIDAPRTVLTLSGGRGYIYSPHRYQHDGERKNSVPSPANTNDAHIILWEMKLWNVKKKKTKLTNCSWMAVPNMFLCWIYFFLVIIIIFSMWSYFASFRLFSLKKKSCARKWRRRRRLCFQFNVPVYFCVCVYNVVGYVSPPLPCLYAKKLGQQKKNRKKKLFPFSVYKYVQG